MSLKLPMGRYRVTETVPNGYLDTSPRSVVFADFCNWKTAPIRKDLYYASWKKPTITATFTQINPSGSKTLLTSSQCWIEVWTWGAKIDTIYPNTSGRGSYTLKGNTSLDLKPNCNPTSHLFAVGGDRRYDYTAGNQVLYFDFKYMPNLINMGDSSIADSGNRSVLGATKASGILDEITAYLRQLIAKSEQVLSKVNK
jgi:hypothetical protein